MGGSQLDEARDSLRYHQEVIEELWSSLDRQSKYTARIRREQKESQRQLTIVVGKVEDLRDRRDEGRCHCRQVGTLTVPIEDTASEGGDEGRSSSVGPPIVSRVPVSFLAEFPTLTPIS